MRVVAGDMRVAERGGFEPPIPAFGQYNGLANRRFQPLSHLSTFLANRMRKLLPTQASPRGAQSHGQHVDGNPRGGSFHLPKPARHEHFAYDNRAQDATRAKRRSGRTTPTVARFAGHHGREWDLTVPSAPPPQAMGHSGGCQGTRPPR